MDVYNSIRTYTTDDCTVRSTSSVEVHVSSTSPGPEKNIIIAIAVGVPSLGKRNTHLKWYTYIII